MIDSQLLEIAQKIRAAIPGRILQHKCGRAIPENAILMAIYDCLEKELLFKLKL